MTARAIIADPATLRSDLRLCPQREIRGHVLDCADPERRFVVELLIDGACVAVGLADQFRSELADQGFGDGCYGFGFVLPETPLEAVEITARIANSVIAVGAPIAVGFTPPAASPRGQARWEGDLTVAGWIAEPSGDATPIVDVYVDGECVVRTHADRWTYRGETEAPIAVRRFEARLPARFADGRARRARVVDGEGEELPGSPVAFVAFEDGLARFLEGRAVTAADAPRGEPWDRVAPPSAPFDAFERWRARFAPAVLEAEPHGTVAVALIGEGGAGASLDSLEAQRACVWVAGALGADGDPLAFRGLDLRHFLDEAAAGAQAIVFAPMGTVFEPDALNRLARALDEAPGAMLVYPDIVMQDEAGGAWPIAFPDFDAERALEQGYGALVFAARPALVADALAEGADDSLRVFTYALDRLAAARDADRVAPVHVAAFLARTPPFDLRRLTMRLVRAANEHFQASGVAATAEPGRGSLFPAARVRRPRSAESVSLVLVNGPPLAEIPAAIRRTAEAFVGREREILVVCGADSPLPERVGAVPVRRIRPHGPFDFNRFCNAAATAASGETLLFLDARIAAPEPDWGEELIGRLAAPDVGAAGPTILAGERAIAAAGYVLGCAFAAAPAFADETPASCGYADMLAVARQTSAIPSLGMAIRRALMRELNGFDVARFPDAFADVDFCLRLRAKGLRLVVTPHARIHAPPGLLSPHPALRASGRGLANLRLRWGPALLDDPFYNPALALTGHPFSALAWPPRTLTAR